MNLGNNFLTTFVIYLQVNNQLQRQFVSAETRISVEFQNHNTLQDMFQKLSEDRLY